jgi:hypothetical protein
MGTDSGSIRATSTGDTMALGVGLGWAVSSFGNRHAEVVGRAGLARAILDSHKRFTLAISQLPMAWLGLG